MGENCQELHIVFFGGWEMRNLVRFRGRASATVKLSKYKSGMQGRDLFTEMSQ